MRETQRNIKEIKERIQRSNNKINAIKDCFKDETALVVSAGPSAQSWSSVYDKISVGDVPIVCCVKQTVNIPKLSSLCDLHFINPYNLVRYSDTARPIVVFSGATDAPRSHQKYDIGYEVVKSKNASLKDTLAYKCNFEDFSLENSGDIRPWGPGIMYESVIYTLIHMGVKNIHTVGWDIADYMGSNHHFYDSKGTINYDEIIYKSLIKIIPVSIVNYLFFKFGWKYNRAEMLPGEAEITRRSISSLKEWAAEKGVSIVIHSTSEWMKKNPI